MTQVSKHAPHELKPLACAANWDLFLAEMKANLQIITLEADGHGSCFPATVAIAEGLLATAIIENLHRHFRRIASKSGIAIRPHGQK